ncbi:MAG TPA: hypothetical protein VNJ01_07190 [Bacteriovoracaceae bacterium]|nr:hypothetical protein [Bacteriovoracaceae bacterium]
MIIIFLSVLLSFIACLLPLYSWAYVFNPFLLQKIFFYLAWVLSILCWYLAIRDNFKHQQLTLLYLLLPAVMIFTGISAGEFISKSYLSYKKNALISEARERIARNDNSLACELVVNSEEKLPAEMSRCRDHIMSLAPAEGWEKISIFVGRDGLIVLPGYETWLLDTYFKLWSGQFKVEQGYMETLRAIISGLNYGEWSPEAKVHFLQKITPTLRSRLEQASPKDISELKEYHTPQVLLRNLDELQRWVQKEKSGT